MTTTIQPIDSFVFAGFQQRFQQVFNCPCLFINQNDRTKVIDRIFGQGNPIEYPYAYFVIQRLSANNDSYNPHQMGRRGITLNVDSDQTIQTVRVLPTTFEVEVNYITNKMESTAQGSVIAFARRWLLARRFGYLKFSINYGNLQFGVGTTLPEEVPIPQRENITETETKYDVVTTIAVHGYVSEPMLGRQGKVNKVNLNQGIQLPKGQVVSTQTFTWDKPQ